MTTCKPVSLPPCMAAAGWIREGNSARSSHVRPTCGVKETRASVTAA